MTDTLPAADAPPRAQGLLCPVCRVGLALADRQGIEIDYCPQCRGIWLDRGELDKIIERDAAYEASGPAPQGSGPGYAAPAPGYAQSGPWGHDDGHQNSGHHGGGRHGGDRHGGDRHGGDRHGGDRHGGGGHDEHRRGGFLAGLFRD